MKVYFFILSLSRSIFLKSIKSIDLFSFRSFYICKLIPPIFLKVSEQFINSKVCIAHSLLRKFKVCEYSIYNIRFMYVSSERKFSFDSLFIPSFFLKVSELFTDSEMCITHFLLLESFSTYKILRIHLQSSFDIRKHSFTKFL